MLTSVGTFGGCIRALEDVLEHLKVYQSSLKVFKSILRCVTGLGYVRTLRSALEHYRVYWSSWGVLERIGGVLRHQGGVL